MKPTMRPARSMPTALSQSMFMISPPSRGRAPGKDLRPVRRRRVGAGESLAHRAAEQPRHFVRALVEHRAGDRRALRRSDELLRIGDLDLNLEQREDEQEDHFIALARFAWSSSVVSGPAYFATILPLRSRKNVSGTPPTPYAMAVFPDSSSSVG